MEHLDILHKTLNQMEYYFSSNKFCITAKKNGYPNRLISDGKIADFLHRNAIQLDSKRMWRKKYDLFEYNIEKPLEPNKEEEAKILLKSLGYKIMKEVKEWREI